MDFAKHIKEDRNDPVSRLRQAFDAQAVACEIQGSPFMASLLQQLPLHLSTHTEIGRQILEWKGDPLIDQIPVRIAAGLNFLAISGKCAELSAIWPPKHRDDVSFADALTTALTQHSDLLSDWVNAPPQHAIHLERSSIILGACLWLADHQGCSARDRLDLQTYELFAGTGLTMNFASWRHELGANKVWNVPNAAVALRSDWRGQPAKIEPNFKISSQFGVDPHPIKIASDADENRTLAYIWADQRQKLARLEAALDTLDKNSDLVDRAAPETWISSKIENHAKADAVQLIYSTQASNRWPNQTDQKIRNNLSILSRSLGEHQTIAYLELKEAPTGDLLDILLTIFPEGKTYQLGTADILGHWVNWKASAELTD